MVTISSQIIPPGQHSSLITSTDQQTSPITSKKLIRSRLTSISQMRKDLYHILRNYRTSFKYPHKLERLYSCRLGKDDSDELSCVICIKNIIALLNKVIPEEIKVQNLYHRLEKKLIKLKNSLKEGRKKESKKKIIDVLKIYTAFFRTIKDKKISLSADEQDWSKTFLPALHIWGRETFNLLQSNSANAKQVDKSTFQFGIPSYCKVNEIIDFTLEFPIVEKIFKSLRDHCGLDHSKSTVWLTLIINPINFKVQDRIKEIKFIVDKNQVVIATFNLTPLKKGVQNIELELLYSVYRLAYFIIQIDIIDGEITLENKSKIQFKVMETIFDKHSPNKEGTAS